MKSKVECRKFGLHSFLVPYTTNKQYKVHRTSNHSFAKRVHLVENCSHCVSRHLRSQFLWFAARSHWPTRTTYQEATHAPRYFLASTRSHHPSSCHSSRPSLSVTHTKGKRAPNPTAAATSLALSPCGHVRRIRRWNRRGQSPRAYPCALRRVESSRIESSASDGGDGEPVHVLGLDRCGAAGRAEGAGCRPVATCRPARGLIRRWVSCPGRY
jgi:hypothetical protein